MCGRMNVTDHPGIQDLLDDLGIEYPISPQLNIAPGSEAEFIINNGGDPDLIKGYWSMLIEPKPSDPARYRPNPKYKTFNAQSRRLYESRLWNQAYTSRRCIIPVSGFHEWKDGCYNVTAADGRALVLAGLYQINDFHGVIVPSFSVITLPPQPAFSHIHDKSFPFFLKPEEYESWLNPAVRNTDTFDPAMAEGIRFPIRIARVIGPNDLTEKDIQFI